MLFSIQKLIQSEITRSGISVKELAKRIGYTNVSKTMRNIDELCRGGEKELYRIFNGELMRKISEILLIDMSVIDKAVEATKKEFIEERERLKLAEIQREKDLFRPFIFILTENRRPSSITCFCFVGGCMKIILPPDNIDQLPEEEQFDIVRKLSAKNYLEYNGQCPLFGKVTGYLYRQKYGRSIEFDVEGNIFKETGYEYCIVTPLRRPGITVNGKTASFLPG